MPTAMPSRCFDVHTILVNAFAAFAGHHDPFPHPLADTGYVDWRIEPRIPAGGETANPDVGAFAETRNRSLFCDAKGEASSKRDRFGRQLARYARVEAADVLQYAGFSLTSVPDAATHVHSFIIVCPSSARHGIEQVVESLGHAIPILELDLGEDPRTLLGFEVHAQPGLDDDLVAVLTCRLPGPCAIPMYLFPYGPNSDDLQVAHAVVPQLVAFVLRSDKDDAAGLADICRGVFPMWERIDPEGRGQLVGKARPVMARAAQSAFRDYVHFADDTVTVTKVPGDSTRTAQSLQDAFSRMVSELGGDPYSTPPVQLSLPMDPGRDA